MEQTLQFVAGDILWGQMGSPRQASFQGYTTQARYITMKDGVQLAADVFLPACLDGSQKIPTLLYRTRYWRAMETCPPIDTPDVPVQFFTSYGYAVVKLDVRGTGASFGAVEHEWQALDTQDTAEVLDWIITQPWSDGRVGAYGISYPGTCAELLAETCHPAVTAIWAAYFELDGYSDISFPGGVPSKFIPVWGEYTHHLDHNQRAVPPGSPVKIVGVKPVDEDGGHRRLIEAVEQHRANRHVDELMKGMIFRDDPLTLSGASCEQMAVYPRRAAIERSGVPLDIWGSWMDANTADTVIRQFATFKNPFRGVIGAWNHGGSRFYSPFVPPVASLPAGAPGLSREVQFYEMLRFFDQHFEGLPSGLPERILFYYTLGEERWKSTTQWPPENSTQQRLYLQPGGRLAAEKPGDPDAITRYAVDFNASTGQQNRWWTELGAGPVLYADRAEADHKLVVFDSRPLDEDVEITGYPVVTLYVTSTETDGAFFCYLEDIAPDGKVTYITEGMLRALHRKISPAEPPYRVFAPYHTYQRSDAMPLVPGVIAELSFGLFPTSVLIRAGHQIRLALGGADDSTFFRIPAEDDPVITLAHNQTWASYLDLPVIRK